MPRRTKIVATIGPASDDPGTLAELIHAGMDVARVSLAHGPVDESLDRIARVRAAAAASGRFIGVLADLPGPKIRAAEFPGGGVHLVEDEIVDLVSGGRGATSDQRRVAIDHDGAVPQLKPGDAVALGDGALQLLVESTDGERARARVVTGGWVQGRPGVVLPPGRLSLVAPTDDDLAMLERLCAVDIDAVAISFVQAAADVQRARAAMVSYRSSSAPAPAPMLVAKIETREAVDDLDAIIATADGVMVARGDLGIRVAMEDVPHHQKRIIRTGVAYGRPVITATQMLESMVRSPAPTRAEVTDVANAVFDGSSALMLSGETAIGHHPVLAVSTMARIAVRAEEEFDYFGWGRNLGRQQMAGTQTAPASVRITAAVSAAAWRASIDADVAAILACTNTGVTPRAISRFRPRMPLLGVTFSDRTARQLALAWGVTPMVIDRHGTTDEIVWFAVKAAAESGAVKPGDIVAVVVGSPTDPEPATDTLRLVRVR